MTFQQKVTGRCEKSKFELVLTCRNIKHATHVQDEAASVHRNFDLRITLHFRDWHTTQTPAFKQNLLLHHLATEDNTCSELVLAHGHSSLPLGRQG